jgi:hypothetical protein
MATKYDLRDWVHDAVRANGGKATIVQVAKYIWNNHKSELEESGDLFYTWQYDMRWGAQALRDAKVFKHKSLCQRGVWEIAPSAVKSASIP